MGILNISAVVDVPVNIYNGALVHHCVCRVHRYSWPSCCSGELTEHRLVCSTYIHLMCRFGIFGTAVDRSHIKFSASIGNLSARVQSRLFYLSTSKTESENKVSYCFPVIHTVLNAILNFVKQILLKHSS